jgi:hypothetical protein
MVNSRTKGHTFERLIANCFRETLPEFADQIRRSEQGHGAFGSDITGVPTLWIECQHAGPQTHNPEVKLAQAIRDAAGSRNLPVAITRMTRARSIDCTLRLGDLAHLLHMTRNRMIPFEVLRGDAVEVEHAPVTIDLDAFLLLFRVAKPWTRRSV